MNSSSTIISEPDPTEVRPTISPPVMPMATVGSGRRATSATWPVRACPDRRSSTARATMAIAPASSAAPSAISTLRCAEAPSPISCSSQEPRNAIGTEPSVIHPTIRRLTVPLRRCTAAPTGRITTAATRSLEMAADGLIPNSRISIGVISAPPPAPVSPTSKPTTALPMTT